MQTSLALTAGKGKSPRGAAPTGEALSEWLCPLAGGFVAIHKSAEGRHFGMDAEIQHREVNLSVCTELKSGTYVTGQITLRGLDFGIHAEMTGISGLAELVYTDERRVRVL